MGRFLFQDPTLALPTQGAFTPGTFTNTTITVNSQGIITDILDGVGGGATTFGALTDVDLSGLSTDDIVQFDGSDWVPVTLELNLNSDVTITSPSNDELLIFDGGVPLDPAQLRPRGAALAWRAAAGSPPGGTTSTGVPRSPRRRDHPGTSRSVRVGIHPVKNGSARRRGRARPPRPSAAARG